MTSMGGIPISVETLKVLGKNLIWPESYRAVDNACGRELDGPELLGTVITASILIVLGWMSRKMRATISALTGGMVGIYMALLAFHLLTLSDAPYNGEPIWCAELFLFRVIPLFPAGFFSIMMKSGVFQGTAQKLATAIVLLIATSMVYVSVNIGHEEDHASDHRIWWLFAAQMAIPLVLVWQVLKVLLWSIGFGRTTSNSKGMRHGSLRRASISRVLSGNAVHLKDPRRLSMEDEGSEINTAYHRSSVRRSSISRAIGIQSPRAEPTSPLAQSLTDDEVDGARRSRTRKNSIERVLSP